MKKYFFILFFTFAFASNLFAQINKDLELFKEKYPDEDAVCTSIIVDLEVSIKDNKPVITEISKEESLLLTKRSAVLNTNQVGHSFFNKLLETEAYTLIPENNKYKRMDVKEIEDYKEDGSGIFYDDSKVRKFIFPGLTEGAKTVFNFTMQYNEPWLWGNYFFTNGYTPMENMEVKLTFPDKVKIAWKVIGNDSLKVNFTQTTKGKKTIYQWKAQMLPRLKIEDDGPNFKSYIPVLLLGIAEYTDTDGKTVKMMDGHNHLYAWYRKMINPCKNEVKPEMKSIIDSLINPGDNEKEKVEKIYSWTQNNISYVAFEDGYNGFTPANSQDVFQKKYGDCKGKANLLKELLGIANVKSYLTWVGTNHLPYKRDDLPGKPVDNHMIVTYIGQDGKYYFLDPTDDFISIDFPTIFIQGKEVLIGLSETEFKIMKIPYVEGIRNSLNQSMVLNIDNKKLIGKGKIELNGYNHFLFGGSFRNETYEKQKRYFNAFFEKGNNKFELDTLVFENINNPKDTAFLYFDFKIPDYINTLNDKIFVNLNVDKVQSYKPIKYEGRQCGVYWRYMENLNFKCTLNIPEGYEIESIPADASNLLSAEFGFRIKYSKSGKLIIFEKELYSAFSLLDISKIPSWNSMIKALDKASNQSIVLKKTK